MENNTIDSLAGMLLNESAPSSQVIKIEDVSGAILGAINNPVVDDEVVELISDRSVLDEAVNKYRLERREIIGEVAKKYGILLADTDPTFITVDVALLTYEKMLNHFDSDVKAVVANNIERIDLSCRNLANVRTDLEKASRSIITAHHDQLIKTARLVQAALDESKSALEKMIDAEKARAVSELKAILPGLVQDAVKNELKLGIDKANEGLFEIDKKARTLSEKIEKGYIEVRAMWSRGGVFISNLICSFIAAVIVAYLLHP